jgi:hypothetical protein
MSCVPCLLTSGAHTHRLIHLFVPAVSSKSFHKLSDLTDSAEFEGFARPQTSDFEKKEKTSSEPWLRNRLKNNISFWRTFCSSVLVLSILTTGYKLPWSAGPPPGPKFMRNHPSAFEHPAFVTECNGWTS